MTVVSAGSTNWRIRLLPVAMGIRQEMPDAAGTHKKPNNVRELVYM